MQEEIAALELCEDDQTILRQMIAELPQQQEVQKELSVSLCFHWNLFPLAPKKPKKKAAAKDTKPKKEKPKEEATQPDTKAPGRKKLLGQLWQCARKPLQMILSDLCLHHLDLRASCGASDSAQAATGSQKMGIVVYTLLGTIQNFIRVRSANLQIQPDFLAEETDWSIRFRLSIHPIVWLGAALRFAGSFIIGMIGKMKKQSKKQKQDSTNPNRSGGKPPQEQAVS